VIGRCGGELSAAAVERSADAAELRDRREDDARRWAGRSGAVTSTIAVVASVSSKTPPRAPAGASSIASCCHFARSVKASAARGRGSPLRSCEGTSARDGLSLPMEAVRASLVAVAAQH
jgi:hypothetical protein